MHADKDKFIITNWLTWDDSRIISFKNRGTKDQVNTVATARNMDKVSSLKSIIQIGQLKWLIAEM